MGIISWLRSRKKNNSEAMRILSELGCFKSTNGITPSMCNAGMINEIIINCRRKGKTETADELESWLNQNRRRLL
jgi:hypothetical protein